MKLLIFIIITIMKILSLVIPLLISVAYLTLAERKVLGAMQKRKGPNVVGYFGLLQPFSDGIKLLLKESIIPINANKLIFIFGPILTFSLAIVGWFVIPIDFGVVISDINLGLLYVFAISSLNVYGIIIAGWSSNSRYAFLGALRSAAQIISYEVSFGLILVNLLLCTRSLNFTKIVIFQQHIWFILPFFPLFFIFIISILAETNRPPFDLPEAEAELVSGYNIEYSAVGFALFFIGEYANIILISALTTLLFLGGWNFPLFPFIENYIVFSLKTTLIVFIFIWVRAALPRFRYDQLIKIGWKIFLPFSIGYVFFTSCLATFILN